MKACGLLSAPQSSRVCLSTGTANGFLLCRRVGVFVSAAGDINLGPTHVWEVAFFTLCAFGCVCTSVPLYDIFYA